MVLVEEVENKSVRDIAAFINDKAKKMQKNKEGDAEHKKRTGTASFLPAFMVSILLDVASFISVNLGMSIPAMALKKNQFGAGTVTALGGFNFEDALAPFSGIQLSLFRIYKMLIFRFYL